MQETHVIKAKCMERFRDYIKSYNKLSIFSYPKRGRVREKHLQYFRKIKTKRRNEVPRTDALMKRFSHVFDQK